MRSAAGLFLVAAFTVSALTGGASGQEKKKDEYVGAIWALNVKNMKGEWIEAMKVRATLKGELMFDGKQIGTHKTKGDDLTMVIDKKGPKLNGAYKLTKVKMDNTWWAGTLKRDDDGAEVPVRLRLLKD